MATRTTTVIMDETTWQGEFYRTLFGDDYLDSVHVDRSTDGYTRGIIFEHKQNVQSYGESKALSQALIYLARFNRDGVPVPAKICLVGQEEQTCYIYESIKYMKYIDNIPDYANLKASDGIAGFTAGARYKKINFNMDDPARGMREILDFVEEPPENVKVTVNVHNVYGWANYYYDHAKEHRQKPEKKAFFAELRAPQNTLANFINPWTGVEKDFQYIMDVLNDPMTQKKLGAFYTPPQYAKKATELVKMAINRVPQGNDYVIIDRCAGTGNLEMYLDDGHEDILSHVIISTYELKEWMVLKDRYEGQVRYIIPPVPSQKDELPMLNDEGFLSGANALSHDIIDNPIVRKHIDDENCTIILFENPPYAETTSAEFQRRISEDEEDAEFDEDVIELDEEHLQDNTNDNAWKQSYVVTEMKKEVSGTATNDIGNVFIWSAFKYFLRQPTDSYIVFSPIKYWKAQHLIQKKMVEGYAFNRKHFHTKIDACISVILWSNEDDERISTFDLLGFDMDDRGNLCPPVTLPIKKVRTRYSETYYDKREIDENERCGILVGLNGLEKTGRNKPARSDDIIGYMVAHSSGFDNPDLDSSLLVAGRYDGNGFYLRKDNFVEKLPMFAASRYIRYNREWTERARIMKSGDRSAQYTADVEHGLLDTFLCSCLIFACLEIQNHCRSFRGTDGYLYKNELCFDNLDGKTTLAIDRLENFIQNGYNYSDQEKALFSKWNYILQFIHENCKDEYDPTLTYGLYQISQEVDVKIVQGVTSKGEPKKVYKYGDLHNAIKDLKNLIGEYYIQQIVPTLFEYEYLK